MKKIMGSINILIDGRLHLATLDNYGMYLLFFLIFLEDNMVTATKERKRLS